MRIHLQFGITLVSLPKIAVSLPTELLPEMSARSSAWDHDNFPEI